MLYAFGAGPSDRPGDGRYLPAYEAGKAIAGCASL